MAAIEVLAPLRIETRFYPPGPGHANWRLKLRVYPDEFSMARRSSPPSPNELDRLQQALIADPGTGVIEPAAFSTLAMAVGASRAVWLARNFITIGADGSRGVDRSTQAMRDPDAKPNVHLPSGLPPRLDVWLLPKAGAPVLAATMLLKRDEIVSDLDLLAFGQEAAVPEAELPLRWWTSFERAREVGMGVEIEAGAAPPELDAIVVAGIGDVSPDELIAAHADSGRLAVLRPGTPTNTVEGEPTVELGKDATAWWPLLAADINAHPGAATTWRALTGLDGQTPLMGGDFEPAAWRRSLVAALWPALWGRSIREVSGALGSERPMALWAQENLAPEGPYAAIRVGEQPYGLLPAAALDSWLPGADDPPIEQHVRAWAIAWRELAAAATGSDCGVVDADTEKLMSVLGENAPTHAWGIRAVMPLADANAFRTAAGLPALDPTTWDQITAKALGNLPGPWRPLAPVTALFDLPEHERLRWDKPDLLRQMLSISSEQLRGWREPLGLLGHLLLESLLMARALVGLAYKSLNAGLPVDPDAALPAWPDAADLFDLVYNGNDAHLAQVEAAGDEGREVARRFNDFRKAALDLVDGWEQDPGRIFDALLAALDTASHRIDPWVTGLADRRLRAMTARQTPRFLGAYAWVEQPRPYTGLPGSPPPPGPTAAGLLHAPSHTQALTAALLRDAAVRHPGDKRWNIALDSQKVRDARRLAERVRMGVHPYEALGLEVERLIGDWNVVRELRNVFPLAEGQDGRRTCDGARVLRVVLHSSEPMPAVLAPLLASGLATRLQPLDHVLDSYADLLVADGVHAQVSGRGDLAQAAMEAAAGLSAPPELRAMRTPRAATEVEVSVWAMIKPADAPDDAAPVIVADPAFGMLLDEELGLPTTWTWEVHGAGVVSLSDLGMHGADLLAMGSEDIDATIRGAQPTTTAVRSTGGAEKLEQARRLADLLGGGEDEPVVADPGSSRDDERVIKSAVRIAMIENLTNRLVRLKADARSLLDDAAALPAGIADVATAAHFGAWGIGLHEGDAIQTAVDSLKARYGAASIPVTVNALRRAIRALAGNTRLPVVPLVNRSELGELLPAMIDRDWLEIVAAVRPRLAQLEAWQLSPPKLPWPAEMSSHAGDPWAARGNLTVVYGPGVGSNSATVGVAGIDRWTDAIPSTEHATAATFGFNGPKSRPPQAILLGVPADPETRIAPDELLQLVLETRRLAKARAARPDVGLLRVATPSPILTANGHLSFLELWP